MSDCLLRRKLGVHIGIFHVIRMSSKPPVWAALSLRPQRFSYLVGGLDAFSPAFADGGTLFSGDAGWSSPVARQAHNLKVVGSNPAPATTSAVTVDRRPAQIKSSFNFNKLILSARARAYHDLVQHAAN